MVQASKNVSSHDRLRARIKLQVHESLLEAAERSIVEDGVEGASLLSIAKHAGVAVGTIYNYFHDRQELFRELFSKRRSEMLSAIDQGMKEVDGEAFRAQLDHFAHVLLSYYDGRREFMRVVFASEPLRLQMMCDKAGRMRPYAQELNARAERVMRVGVREGLVRDDDLALFTSVFTSILKGVLVATLDEGENENLADVAPRAVRLFCQGALPTRKS
jgi:AcrR family transcriptional regulator